MMIRWDELICVWFLIWVWFNLLGLLRDTLLLIKHGDMAILTLHPYNFNEKLKIVFHIVFLF